MHLPAIVVQALFAVQLPVCLYVGYRTARRTGRRVIDWLIYGFLAAIVFPPLGAVVTLVLFFVCPPSRDGRAPTDGRHGAGPAEPLGDATGLIGGGATSPNGGESPV
jgi:hypothetical protein